MIYLVEYRRGAALVWVLPALAVLAVATVWWLTPGSSTDSDSASKAPSQTAAATAAASRTSQVAYPDDTVGPSVRSAQKSVPVTEVSRVAKPLSTPVRQAVAARKLSDRSVAEIQQSLAGDWEGHYQGDRQMTVDADGQGTMVAHPEGLAATLLAAELTFKFNWKLNGELLEFETVGGEPAEKVNVVVQMYGRKRFHKIVELQADQMVLLDEDGKTKYHWKRVAGKLKDRIKEKKAAQPVR